MSDRWTEEARGADADAIETYRSLLLKRDALLREGEQFRCSYLSEFGELLKQEYFFYYESIKYEEILNYCRCQGENNINGVDLREYIDKVTEEERNGCMEFSQACAHLPRVLTPTESAIIDSRYRELADLLHPSLHPDFHTDFEIYAAWEQIEQAYLKSDLEMLKYHGAHAEGILVKRDCEARTQGEEEETFAPVLHRLDEKIDALQKEIARITHEKPYLYGAILQDGDAEREESIRIKRETIVYQDRAFDLQHQLRRYHLDNLPK